MRWKVVGGLATGTSHLESNLPCQDRYFAEQFESRDGGPVLIIAVSDGAGSAVFSETGASAVCLSLGALARAALQTSSNLDEISDEHIRSWFMTARGALRTLAANNDSELSDYSATGLLAIIGDHQVVCAQIGDGGIVVRAPGDVFTVAIWPEGGEYANETFFVTDSNLGMRVSIRRFDTIEDVIVFSDGLQRLALHTATRSAHPPFFEALIRAVRNGRSGDDLSAELVAYLNSPEINARTDDDKTLVIGCRN